MMTMHAAILRELMIAGYQDAALLKAFERMCAAVALGAAGSSPDKASAKLIKVPRLPDDRGNIVAIERDIPIATSAPAHVPQFMVVPPPENAKAIAQKALGTSQMAPSTVAVGFALIENFNLKTGRCDPGMTSLAKRLKVDLRTVQRAIRSLVAEGLFARVPHGGRGHANAYQVNWVLMAARAAASEQKPKATILSSDHDKNVAQNLLRKPDSDSMMGQPQRRRASPPPDRRQGYLPLAITGGRAKAVEAVRAKLSRQLNEHLTASHIPHDRPAFVVAMKASMQADWDGSIAAEMASEGNGLPILLAGITGVTNGRKATG